MMHAAPALDWPACALLADGRGAKWPEVRACLEAYEAGAVEGWLSVNKEG